MQHILRIVSGARVLDPAALDLGLGGICSLGTCCWFFICPKIKSYACRQEKKAAEGTCLSFLRF